MAFVRTREDGFTVSDDPGRLDLAAIHAFLATSYWAADVSLEEVRQGVERSTNLGLYDSAGAQVGYARLVTDGVRFAYLSDVYVLPDRRGRGLGKFLMAAVMDHPDLRTARRMVLHTADAHGLYAGFGWSAPTMPERLMEWRRSR